MLRLHRALHTSRACFQHAEPAAAAREEITAYLKYFKTPKDLRPLVYRKRNASELLSRDLWDPVAKERIVPLEPPSLPSKSALAKLFDSADSVDELYELREVMLNLARKPKYTTSYHIISFLEKSAELRKLPHALTYIYTQEHLRHVFDADVTNIILTYIYINPRKSLLNAISKAETAESKIGHKNQITDLLKASIYQKNGAQIPQALLEQITSAEALELPSLNTSKVQDGLAKQYRDKRAIYLQLNPIVRELSEAPVLKDISTVVAAKEFVSQFKQIQEKLETKDAFQSIINKSIFRRPRQPAAAQAEKPEAEA